MEQQVKAKVVAGTDLGDSSPRTSSNECKGHHPGSLQPSSSARRPKTRQMPSNSRVNNNNVTTPLLTPSFQSKAKIKASTVTRKAGQPGPRPKPAVSPGSESELVPLSSNHDNSNSSLLPGSCSSSSSSSSSSLSLSNSSPSSSSSSTCFSTVDLTSLSMPASKSATHSHSAHSIRNPSSPFVYDFGGFDSDASSDDSGHVGHSHHQKQGDQQDASTSTADGLNTRIKTKVKTNSNRKCWSDDQAKAKVRVNDRVKEKVKDKVLDNYEKSRFPPELQASILLALFHLHFVCGICNEVIIDCVCLPCGHNFCTHCLHQWFQFNRICPTCFYPVPASFKLQRIYCVDEFLSELHGPIQELCSVLFGKCSVPVDPVGPTVHRTVSEIQTSVQNARIANRRSIEERQTLKKLRRDHAQRHQMVQSDRVADYSILEQQTELFGGLYSVNLTSVVQFFLSFVTAYIFYEGGDSVDNDFILLAVVSIVVWFLVFMAVMRFMGYEGTFTELMLRLNFVQFVRTEEMEGDEDPGHDPDHDLGPSDQDDSQSENEQEIEDGGESSTETSSSSWEEEQDDYDDASDHVNNQPCRNDLTIDQDDENDQYYPAPLTSPNNEWINDDADTEDDEEEDDEDEWETVDEFADSQPRSSDESSSSESGHL